jgi:hypothetical protein
VAAKNYTSMLRTLSAFPISFHEILSCELRSISVRLRPIGVRNWRHLAWGLVSSCDRDIDLKRHTLNDQYQLLPVPVVLGWRCDLAAHFR